MRTAVTTITLPLLLLAALTAGAQPRNPTWAQPVPAIHLKNLYRIDEGVYRSEQPDAEGFAELYRMGVREVLNLRYHHNDRDEAQGIPLTLHHIRMNAGDPRTEQFIEALRIIRDRRGPIVLHCWHGSDRTGIVAALYRMVFQGWSAAEALDELQYGGYGYHAYYRGIKTYLLGADIQALKQALARQ